MKQTGRLPTQEDPSEQLGDTQYGDKNDGSTQSDAVQTFTAGDEEGSSIQEPTEMFDTAFNGNDDILDMQLDSAWPLEPCNESSISTAMHTIVLANGEMPIVQSFGEDGATNSSTVSPDSLPATINPSSLFDSASISTDSNFSFPDSYLLPMSELALLRAFLRIGARLGCTAGAGMWDMSAKSIFSRPNRLPLLLPEEWEPTPSQLRVPHHPVLDFLPWPSVRERVITVLDLPDDARPPSAAGPLAVVQFVYDMEDTAEGMRIWGGNPCDPQAWEVGQVLFERWWYIFDRAVIDQSNRWRELRGAPRLCLKGPVQEGQPVSELVGEM